MIIERKCKKQNFKYLRQLLITMLCFTMFISMLYQPVYAIDTNDETQNVVNTTAENIEQSVNVYDVNPYVYNVEDISHELVDKREDNIKYFKMHDGTIQAYIYNYDVHELDENNIYQEVDNTLSDNNNDELENTKNNKWKVKFSKKAKDTLLHIHDGNMNIKWGIVGYNSNAEVKYLENDEVNNVLSNKAISQTIVYENILDNVDVQYQVGYKKVKENLVLKNTEAQHVFYYELDTNGYDIELVDNRIEVSKHNEVAYYIEAPYMLDSNGVFHNGITLSIEDKYIKMELDSEWLLSEERAYPVYVDPTIVDELDRSEIKTTSVYSASPNSTQLYSYGGMIVGKEASAYGKVRGALRFELPPLDKDPSLMVVEATITLSQLNYGGNGVTVYPVMGKLLTNTEMKHLTWNIFAGNCQYHNDYIAVNNDTVNKNFRFDITEYVREWYQKGNNYGVGFASENESTAYRYATFVTSTNTGMDSRFPSACITYVSIDGLESYFTYQSMNTMSMGDFYVGDFNGNLIYTYNDFSMSGNHLPVGISHVYNHHQRNKVTPVSETMKFGKGMRLNVSMKITHDEDNDLYELIDEDGTKHYFFKESTDIYAKEFDTDVKLVVSTDKYTIKNRTQELEFSRSTGLLLKVKDLVNNKEQEYTYNDTNQLESITDGADRVTSLEYNASNQLIKITYAGNRVITYTYENDYLKTITQLDGNVITFDYTSTGELESVVNENEGKVIVSYHDNSLKQVYQIKRYGVKKADGSYPEGDYFNMSYDLGETKVTDHNEYTITYMFDRFGHTVSAIDNKGNGMYDVYGNTEDNNHHNLSFESSLQTSTINLAVNHRANGIDGWTSNSAIQTETVEDENPFYDGKAFVLTNTSYIRQQVAYAIDTDESYTVSAYVMINSATQTSNSSDYGAYVGVNVNNTLHKSHLYNVTDEWQRLSYTFTADSAITANSWSFEIGTTNMTGEVLVKNIQLEKGTVANRYNFIENGHFREAAGTTNISGWSYLSDMDSSTDMLKNESGKSLDGTSYFIAYGLVDKAKILRQNIDISGNAGDVFVLSGWNKNEAVIQNGLNKEEHFGVGNTRERSVKLLMVYYNESGGEVGRDDVYFSSNTHNWQYTSGSVVAPADYASVELRLYYSYQKWYGMFDNIQMYVESFGNTYEYNNDGYEEARQDKYGNIVLTEYSSQSITNNGVTTTVDLPSKRQYKRKNDTSYLMTTVYTYTNGKLTKETTYEGDENGTKVVETEYSYDDNGNLESTTVNGEKNYVSGQVEYSTNYITSYTNDKGAVTSYEYNETNGQLNRVIQRGTDNEVETDDIITQYAYDNVSRLQSVTNGESKVEYTYTALGLIDTIKHNTSSTTSDVVYKFSYDSFGNVSSIQVGNGTEYNNLATYVYKTNNGLLDNVTYETNEKISYVYDDLGRVIKIKEDEVVKYSWEYGTDGKVGRFIDHTLTVNGVTRYEYDFNGNVVSEDRGNIHLFNEYNEKNLLQKTGYEVGDVSASITFTYNAIDELTDVVWNTNNTNGSVTYERDDLRRVNKTTYYSNSSKVLETTYAYLNAKNDTTKTTSAIEKVINTVNNENQEFTYSYDEFGNIDSISISKGSTIENSYTYDKLNQLTRENNQELNKTFVYSYDNGGNLTTVKTYDYTIVEDLTGLEPSTDTYEYGDSKWKDLLIEFNDKPITYDEIGNPTEYHDDKVFTWEFRRLERIVDGDTLIEYTYNQDGIRRSKKVGNTTTNYFVSGDRILYETTNNETIYYEYDGTGKVSGLVIGTARYTYVKNGLNDIIGILDSSANLVATYKYDAWGNVSVNNLTNDNLGDLNPFRYRGYYYDSETGYYYLNSRYYDPEVKRFINADSYVSTGQGMLGHNMFAYCQSNPVMYVDSTGSRHVMAEIIGGGEKEFIIHGHKVSHSENIDNDSYLTPWYSPISVRVGNSISTTKFDKGFEGWLTTTYFHHSFSSYGSSSRNYGFILNFNVDKHAIQLNVSSDNTGLYINKRNGNITKSFGYRMNFSRLEFGFEGGSSERFGDTTISEYTNVSVNASTIVYALCLYYTGQVAEERLMNCAR